MVFFWLKNRLNIQWKSKCQGDKSHLNSTVSTTFCTQVSIWIRYVNVHSHGRIFLCSSILTDRDKVNQIFQIENQIFQSQCRAELSLRTRTNSLSIKSQEGDVIRLCHLKSKKMQSPKSTIIFIIALGQYWISCRCSHVTRICPLLSIQPYFSYIMSWGINQSIQILSIYNNRVRSQHYCLPQSWLLLLPLRISILLLCVRYVQNNVFNTQYFQWTAPFYLPKSYSEMIIWQCTRFGWLKLCTWRRWLVDNIQTSQDAEPLEDSEKLISPCQSETRTLYWSRQQHLWAASQVAITTARTG